MRIYKKQSLESLGNFIYYDCPVCGEYSTKMKSDLTRHYSSCECADETDESELETIEDTDVFIKLLKQFVKTNELEKLSRKEGDEIRKYIKDRLIFSINHTINIESFTFQIYEIFFEMTEEDRLMEDQELIAFREYILSKL